MVERDKAVYIIALILTYMTSTTGDNSTSLCQICECINKDNTFTTNCAKRSIEWSSQLWSDSLATFNLTEETNVALILDMNNIERLKRFPKLDAGRVDLSIRRCNLFEIEDGLFKEVKRVRNLDLSHNQLSGDAVRGDVFKGPFNVRQYEPIDLEMLNLESNLVHSLDRRMFIHTPKLKALYLNDNPLDVIDAVTSLALSSVKSLEILDLTNTGLSSLPDGIFHNMKKLKQLYLSRNMFTTVPEPIGATGGTLELLEMNGNRIDQLTDNSFLGLWRLDTLAVGKMRSLKTIKSGAFVQLKSLRKLYLCENNLDYIDREAFRELKTDWPVQEIYLQENRLRNLPFDLLPWDKLLNLNLDDNPWQCDCDMLQNMTRNGIQGRLMQTSRAQCAAPQRVSGELLKYVRAEGVCQEGASWKAAYTRPSNVLVGFSLVVIVLFVGVVAAARYARWRSTSVKGVTRLETIRYRNM